MALHYLAYRKRNPWKLTWRDPLSGRQRSKSFPDEESARRFATTQEELAAREKILLKRARQKKRNQQIGNHLTIEELVEAYLAVQCQRMVTKEGNRYHLRPLLALFGKRKASSLTPEDIRAFCEAQRLRGIAQSTVNRRVGILRAAYNWGVREGKLKESPLARLRLPQAKSRRIAPPTPQELRALLDNAVPHVKRVVLLGLYTGARIGPSELFRLQWSDVDLEAGMVRMPSAAKNQGPDGRDVPLRADITTLLRQWKHEDDALGCPYVIHYRGEAVHRISHAWHKSLRAAKISRRLRPYDLRHAFATYALAGGADIASVAEIMAHSDVSMILRVYQHIDTSQKRAAVDAVLPGTALIAF